VNIILTGSIGAGKSTVVRAAMNRLGWREPAGYFTRWGDPGRTLFIETWNGRATPVARPAAAAPDALSPPLVFDRARFTREAMAALAPGSGNPVVVDELGVLELGADDLARRLAAVFQGPAGVLAVIQQRAFERWMAILDPRTLTHVFTVDPSTRNDLPARIAALFQA